MFVFWDLRHVVPFPHQSEATVTELAAKVERQLAERGAQRPAGGVNVAPMTTKKKKEEEPEQDVVQELLVRVPPLL